MSPASQQEGVRETQSTLAEDRRSSEQVQIIDSSNHVVAWSIRGLRGDPISALRPAPGKTAKEQQLQRVPALGDDDEVLVSARGVEVHEQHYVVLVAAPLEVQTDTLSTVGILLLAAAPFLVAPLHRQSALVGQSLKIVEDPAAGGDRRSPAHERVEVPPTGDDCGAGFDHEPMLDKLEDSTTRTGVLPMSHELRSPLSTPTTAEVASLTGPADVARYVQTC
jgi:hypothetical protein